MLAVTPLRSSAPGDIAGDAGGAATNLITFDDFSVDFDFDFSDLFDGFDDAEPLPGLELEVNAVDSPAPETSMAEVETSGDRDSQREEREEEEEMGLTIYEEVLSCEMKEEASVAVVEINSPAAAAAVAEKDRGRKSTARQTRGSNGKRKVKVDWTAELHRRFVQAVEQLGLEKAVPSRILELMRIDCLTRHNVASHLQKYRSHRKHMMAREADQTMSSNKKYQMFTTWLPPTMGFPPSYLPPPHYNLHHHPHMQHYRPLHVWGHPTINQSLVHMWPKHIVPIGLTPSPPWVAPHPIQPPPISPHGSPWPPHFAKTTLTQETPYFPAPLPTLRFSVPGIPPHPMYKPDSTIPAVAPPTPPPCKQAGSLLQVDVHPSKESIDAALGGVLAQPWLPLPLGLKPPSLESVMVELHKQGISNVPPCNS